MKVQAKCWKCGCELLVQGVGIAPSQIVLLEVEPCAKCSPNVDLLEVLETIAPYINNNWTDLEYHNADGTGWVTLVNEAISIAKGGQ